MNPPASSSLPPKRKDSDLPVSPHSTTLALALVPAPLLTPVTKVSLYIPFFSFSACFFAFSRAFSVVPGPCSMSGALWVWDEVAWFVVVAANPRPGAILGGGFFHDVLVRVGSDRVPTILSCPTCIFLGIVPSMSSAWLWLDSHVERIVGRIGVSGCGCWSGMDGTLSFASSPCRFHLPHAHLLIHLFQSSRLCRRHVLYPSIHHAPPRPCPMVSDRSTTP